LSSMALFFLRPEPKTRSMIGLEGNVGT
jgi:hypothetical protein